MQGQRVAKTCLRPCRIKTIRWSPRPRQPTGASMSDNKIENRKLRKRPRSFLSRRKIVWLWCFLGLAVPTSWLAYQWLGPRAALTISPETTWAIGPLTKDGYVDYAAFLVQQHGTDAAYADSAMARLNCGYTLGQDVDKMFTTVSIRHAFANALMSSSEWGDLDDTQFDAIRADNKRRIGRPFTSFKDCLTASAIAENSRWFEALRLAAESPLHIWRWPDDPEDEPSDPMTDLFDLLAVDHNHCLGHNLRHRIMLSLGEQRFADVWPDIELMRKIASRGKSAPNWRFQLETKGLEMSACECMAIALLELKSMPPDLTNWVATFPIKTSVEDLRHHFDQNARISWLNQLQFQHRKPRVKLDFDWNFLRNLTQRRIEAAVDWDLWMRRTNQFTEAIMLDACPQKIYPRQRDALVDWYTELIEPMTDLSQARISSPSFLEVAFENFHAANELTARYRFVHIVFALARWKQTHGQFPETLQQLPVSAFTTEEVLTDPFSGKPFLFKSDGNSFVLYSVGVNLKDDFGWHQGNLPRKYQVEPEYEYEAIDVRTGRNSDDIAFRSSSRHSNIFSWHLGL